MAGSSDEPQDDPQTDGHEHGRRRQGDGAGQLFGNDRHHRAVAKEGDAQVTLQEAKQVLPVLDEQRFIEAQFILEGADRLRRAARLGKHQGRRVAGQEPHDHEHQRGDAPQDGDGAQETAGDIAYHLSGPVRAVPGLAWGAGK